MMTKGQMSHIGNKLSVEVAGVFTHRPLHVNAKNDTKVNRDNEVKL